MLNVHINWLRVATICALALVAISSFYLRLPQYSFITETTTPNKAKNTAPALLLSKVKMVRFNDDGSKHSTIKAKTVKQYDNQGELQFEQPQLLLFSAQPWDIQSALATADAAQETMVFSETVTAKHKKTIIETPSLIVSQKTQKAYSSKGVTVRNPSVITTAQAMTAFLQNSQIILSTQVKTRYVTASDF